MKSIFGTIHTEFRGYLELLDDLIPVLIYLTNYNIKKHPLRANNHPDIEIGNNSTTSIQTSSSDEQNNVRFDLGTTYND